MSALLAQTPAPAADLETVLPELTAAFAATAAEHDRDSSFPFENFAELHRRGLLALTEAQMIGANYRFNLAGSAALRPRTLDMTALLASPNGSLKLPFLLKGPVDAPDFDIETEAFLSPAGTSLVPTRLTR